jgi:hypothetical protein
MGARASRTNDVLEDKHNLLCGDPAAFTPGSTILVDAIRHDTQGTETIELEQVRVLGKGAFGVVNEMLLRRPRKPDSEPEAVAVKLPNAKPKLAERFMSQDPVTSIGFIIFFLSFQGVFFALEALPSERHRSLLLLPQEGRRQDSLLQLGTVSNSLIQILV